MAELDLLDDGTVVVRRADGFTVEINKPLGPDAGDPEDEDEFDNPWIGD